MPLLGIFGKKSKASRSHNDDDASAHSQYTLSPSSSYVVPDIHHPVSPTSSNAHSVYPSANPGASSSKLRLFGRKKNTPAIPSFANGSTASINTAYTSPGHMSVPRPSYTGRVSTSTVPEFDNEDVLSSRRMRPPPSKSAIFAAYNDPSGALSTRSLPAAMTPDSPSPPFRAELHPHHPHQYPQQHHTQKLKKDPPSPPPPAPPPKKRPGLFPWSKSTPSSPVTKAPSPPSPQVQSLTQTPEPIQDSSFNLKSFRQIRASSPPIPPINLNLNNSAVSLSNSSLAPPPIPRPRGASVNSDSSQRISVAAFREAQARRSQAGSPSPGPDLRSASPIPPSASQNGSPAVAPGRRENIRRSTAPVSMLYGSSTDEEDDEEEEDSDDENDTMRPQRKRTITNRSQSRPRSPSRPGKSKARAQSELGHGMASKYTASPRSHLGHGAISYTQPLRGGDDDAEDRANGKGKWAPPRSQSSLGTYANGRQRASVSTSAISPSAAAKRASVIAQANSQLADSPADALTNYKRASRHVRDSSTYSNPAAPPAAAAAAKPDSDSSDDDTPLGTLLPPRRPGSAMSSYSNGSRTNLSVNNNSRTNVATPPASRQNSQIPPHKPLIDINELKQRPPQVGAPKKNDEAFTGGLLGAKLVESPLSSPTVSSPTPSFGLVSKVPPGRFVSPPASPAKEIQAMQFVSSGSMPVEATHERNDSALSNNSTSTSRPMSTSPPPEKRDIFGERLARVVKNQIQTRSSSRPDVGRADSGGSSSTGTTGSGGRGSSSSPPPPLPTQNVNQERGRTMSPVNGLAMSESRDKSSPRRPTLDARLSGGRGTPTPKSPMLDPPSSPDEELARMLGGGINLISVNGREDETESESESEEESEEEEDGKERKKGEGERGRGQEEKKEDIFLPPIPIKQRSPPPAFSVTSRPQHPRNSLSVDSTATLTPLTSNGGSRADSPANAGAQRMRQRSSTLLPPSTGSMAPFPNAASSPGSSTPGSSSSGPDLRGSGSNSTITSSQAPRTGVGARQRSSTMVPISSPTASKMGIGMGMPSRPFAGPQRRDSPASSTGDSSSGRAPLTPRDGSEIGASGKARDRGRGEKVEKEEWGSGVSGLGAKPKHLRRKSVNFDDEVEGRANGKGKGPEEETDDDTREERRKERRRSEAKAAIELGNVINGRGPIVDDDDDDEDDMPINQAMNARMSTAMNNMMPMQPTGGWPGMNMNMPMGGMWSQPPSAGPQMLSPAQFMIPPPNTNDPSFLAAHQQAMMYAKQAYQIAVAQQAMAAAADEWERGSAYGGGSVYGGGSSASVMNMPMGSPFGMSPMGMMNMQNGMGMNNGWSTGSVIFPSSRSMYNGNVGPGPMSSSRSEYGGGGGGRNFSSSRSSYAEFSPSSSSKNRMSRPGEGRDSGYFPPMPPIPKEKESSSRQAGRSRTASQPASPGNRTPGRKAPPSSWKASGI